MTFTTLENARNFLGITDPARDTEITYTLTHASEEIWDYLTGPRRPEAPWDELTAPPIVQRCTLMLLGEYWEHRGDDQKNFAAVWDEIAILLVRMRDPALA